MLSAFFTSAAYIQIHFRLDFIIYFINEGTTMNPDLTAPLGAVWSGFLELQYRLPKNKSRPKKFFQELYQSVKQFGSRSGLTFYQSWHGSKLFA